MPIITRSIWQKVADRWYPRSERPSIEPTSRSRKKNVPVPGKEIGLLEDPNTKKQQHMLDFGVTWDFVWILFGFWTWDWLLLRWLSLLFFKEKVQAETKNSRMRILSFMSGRPGGLSRVSRKFYPNKNIGTAPSRMSDVLIHSCYELLNYVEFVAFSLVSLLNDAELVANFDNEAENKTRIWGTTIFKALKASWAMNKCHSLELR